MSNEVDDLRARLAKSEREREIGRLREAAMMRITQRINQHPLDVDGTLIAIAEAARSLTDADGARVWLVEGEFLVPGPDSTGASAANTIGSQARRTPLSDPAPGAIAVRECRTIAVDDISAYFATREDGAARLAEIGGLRSMLAAPFGNVEPVPGLINVFRATVRPFGAIEQATLEAFATQAAVAIETARAQSALANGLERETATADILGIISRSPGDLQPVLDRIAELASELLDAMAVILFPGEDTVQAVAIARDGVHIA